MASLHAQLGWIGATTRPLYTERWATQLPDYAAPVEIPDQVALLLVPKRLHRQAIALFIGAVITSSIKSTLRTWGINPAPIRPV